ncbi:wall-associated receptor kinase-like 14 [Selaginella moellendorffii]|uniref:wall-associated receptor kinase-like 14 n=1 Tax=Selaginella moellendorffii TaxID=88036 RepID=UPI000D1D0F10|nr:wall-associated receptor kinase-like 14 [Selaginella moellendorffii]XP_024523333.1 wall-associated receptor kinase-like 14 [Selaginella moellendorffii]|eukprot:XP_002993997.2 wall-associated receptor kinase-like 14 [Selaginella moellendorffii]
MAYSGSGRRRRRRRIHFHPLVLPFLWISLAIPIQGSPRAEEAQASPDCVYRCGNTTVPYPFFIAPSSPPPSHHSCGHLKLHCEHGTLKLKISAASYRVLGFTRSNVIIIDPQGCGGGGGAGVGGAATAPSSFTISNNTNYALSFGNLLMLYGCTNNTACYNNCNFNSRAVHWPYAAGGQHGCGVTPQCCYDLQFASLTALRDIDLGSFNCSGFSSLVTTFKEKGEDVSVEAREGLGLEWWLNGSCPAAAGVAAAEGSLCARNAMCVAGTFGGHTCRCEEKFHGDPYRAGCRPDGRRHSKVVRGSIMFAGILAGATVLAAVVIALALLAARSRHHRRRLSTTFRSMRDAKQLAKLVSRTGSSKAVTLFSYKDLERATKDFSPAQMLGHGGHGTVYKGKLPDGRDVAVKRINHISSHGIEQVLNEVKVLLSVSHPNLVQLLGCCLEVYDPLLVYEFVPNGTLAEHLQRERGDGLDWFTRVAIAAEAAQGIAYLHSRSPPIYHRDVKSTNILLDGEFNTKVGDFGLSRTALTEASHVSTAPQGTPGYVDPDYHQSFQLSDKSDVYSFGVVLVEMITSMKVVDFTRDKREVNLAALAVGKIATDCLDEIIDPALMIQACRNPVVRCMIQRMAELAFRCLAHEKDARPSMAEVFDEVEGIRHSCLSPGDHSPIRDIKIDESLLTPR